MQRPESCLLADSPLQATCWHYKQSTFRARRKAERTKIQRNELKGCFQDKKHEDTKTALRLKVRDQFQKDKQFSESEAKSCL